MFIFVIATELQKISFKKDFLDIAFSLRKIHYTYTWRKKFFGKKICALRVGYLLI